jgi:hypothetical protein
MGYCGYMIKRKQHKKPMDKLYAYSGGSTNPMYHDIRRHMWTRIQLREGT